MFYSCVHVLMAKLLHFINTLTVPPIHRIVGLDKPNNPDHHFNNEQELRLAIKYLKKTGTTV